MYVTTTEACLCCGGKVGIGMPCRSPCEPYPLITITTTNTKPYIFEPTHKNGVKIDDHARSN